jgi:uncharacterized protein (DUF1697 family)
MRNTFIALLRGINVTGSKTIRMEDLRKCFAGLGFTNVKTYVQSGNIVFEAGNHSVASLADKIGKRIFRDFGFSVSVLVKTSEELERIVRDNPLLKETNIDPSKLHVTFLSAPAPEISENTLQPLAVARERFRISRSEIYLYCPNGYGKTKLSNNAIERKLGLAATTRNWRSVNALLALAASDGSRAK